MPCMLALNKWGVSPNQVTIAAVFLSFGMGTLLYIYPESSTALLLIPIGLFLRMMLNAIDGMLARTFNLQSRLGEILNEIGDVISDLFILIPFAFLSGLEPAFVWLLALGSVLNELCGILAKVVSGERRYDGPMGKSDRAFLIGLIALFILIFPSQIALVNWAFGFAFILTLLSSFLRLKNAM